ncbi:hypothetical protein predicted by Glimmer/Critica [Lactiplantibacillus plantarum]|nr:hypothetical protein predicted by Glimmer/Critica [Lactiplantibacillus plantarum]
MQYLPRKKLRLLTTSVTFFITGGSLSHGRQA